MAITTVKMKLEGIKKFLKTTIQFSLGDQGPPYQRLQMTTEDRRRRIHELTMGNICGKGTPSFLLAFWDFIAIYIVGIHNCFRESIFRKHRHPTGVESKRGMVAIVTGGSRGIGLEVVRQFLKQGMHVIIGSSNPSAGSEQVKQLQLEFPNSKVEYRRLDLTSLKSIKEFASQLLEENLSLHILVNNAGVMFGAHEVTEDGFELQIGLNYIGHFYLTYLLLPQLQKTGTSDLKARIVNVSSCAHFVGRIKIWDLNSRESYSAYGCYCQSKLALVMFTKLLQKYLNAHQYNITVNAVHPGVINTKLYRHTLLNVIPLLTRALFKTAQQGADGIVYVALSNEIEGAGGIYYENCQEEKPSKKSQDKVMQLQLWQETCKLLQIDDFHPPLNS